MRSRSADGTSESSGSVRAAVRRLDRHTVHGLGAEVSVPTYDVGSLRHGVVHLGTGAFHRAHQAVYLDDLARQGHRGWGVVGSALRTGANAAALARQDGLYTVTEIGAGRPSVRVVGVLRDHVNALDHPGRLVDRMAHPDTQLVTLTITAPAYALDAVPEPGADRPPNAFDLVARALARRRATGLGPFTVLACDNLPDNGSAARAGVLAAASLLDPRLATWVERHVAFPSSMVDRITPPADAEHRRWLRRRHAVSDTAPVLCETFRQWVVEDTFCAERPPLDTVGVQLVPDARPYVAMKTGLLNAGHVALGFLGGRAGHLTTAEAMRDPGIVAVLEQLMRDEVAPLLDPVPGTDLDAYRRTLLERFSNEPLADPLERLRARGSVRVAHYVAPALRRAVHAGRPHRALTSLLAAWVEHLAQHPDAPEIATDPAAPVLLPLAATAAADVRPFLVAAGLGDLAGYRSVVDEVHAMLAGPTTDRRTIGAAAS